MAIRSVRTQAPAHHERIGRLLTRVSREVRTVVDRRLDALGLTMQQAELIVWTGLHDEVRPSDLKALLFTDDAGVSRLIDRLVRKRFIARRGHHSDARAHTLELTSAGRALFHRLRRHARLVNRALLRGLSPTEVTHLRALLMRVSENAQVMEGKSS